MKTRDTDLLYINGRRVLKKGGKRAAIAGCKDTGALGRSHGHQGDKEENTYFTGEIAEVLVYTKALNETERRQVERYLMRKYALTGGRK